MSQIEQVMLIALGLEKQGLEPSVALIKARLPNPMPLPVIVKGLTRFKNLGTDEKAGLTPSASQTIITDEQSDDEMTRLKQRLSALEALCQRLIDRIEHLEKFDHTDKDKR